MNAEENLTSSELKISNLSSSDSPNTFHEPSTISELGFFEFFDSDRRYTILYIPGRIFVNMLVNTYCELSSVLASDILYFVKLCTLNPC